MGAESMLRLRLRLRAWELDVQWRRLRQNNGMGHDSPHAHEYICYTNRGILEQLCGVMASSCSFPEPKSYLARMTRTTSIYHSCCKRDGRFTLSPDHTFYHGTGRYK